MLAFFFPDTSISYSSFTGLLLILQLPDGLEPLLSTGNSKDIPALYNRYLNTVLHVQSWYDDNIFDPKTKGYKSIRQVRGMHKRVQSIMNDKFDVKDMNGKERIWLNQYDVAMTQFAFIGLGMLFPAKSGMIAASNEELELINYYWRVLGYLMGIEDEFNACQFDDYKDIKEFNRLLFQHEYQDNFSKTPCEKGLEMTQSICLALHYFMPLLTFNNLAHWWKDCFLFNGYEPQPKTSREKLLDTFTKLSFNHLYKYEAFMRFSTKYHRKRFQARLENRDKVYEKLKTQYKDNNSFTYYSDRVDYLMDKKTHLKDSKPGELVLAQETPVEVPVTSSLEEDNNNNNSDAIVHMKGTCPLGYGSNSINIVKNSEPALVSS